MLVANAVIASDSTKHVFFLHNKILEDMPDSAYSSQYGVYEYDKIIAAFASRGYVLYADERPEDADPDQYSWILARSIDSLMKLGVQPENISVVGSGKGALIAMLASDHVRVGKVRYVLLSGCNKWVATYFYIDLHGSFLSIYEKSDHVWSSCDNIRLSSTGIQKFKEIELTTGLKGGYTYRPIDAWLQPVFSWIED